MMFRHLALALIAGVGCSPGSGSKPALLARRGAEVAARAARADSAAAQGRASQQPIALWLLPSHYNEISGLALTPDGRLLAEGDENSEIWEIDYRRGVVTKRFTIGDAPIKGDFEAIAVAEGKVYLLESKGRIYVAREGAADEHVSYNEYDTGLRKECEFEGMAYDPASRSMLLACKHVLKHAPDDALVLYRWPLPGGASADDAAPDPIVIPRDSLKAHGASWKKFEAADITRDPRTGNFLVLSSLQLGIVELTPGLAVRSVRDLPGKHPQPEGIAVTADGRMIISDEAAGRVATVTVYPAASR
jgi:uncharacterized protein YjiK